MHVFFMTGKDGRCSRHQKITVGGVHGRAEGADLLTVAVQRYHVDEYNHVDEYSAASLVTPGVSGVNLAPPARMAETGLPLPAGLRFNARNGGFPAGALRR